MFSPLVRVGDEIDSLKGNDQKGAEGGATANSVIVETE